MPSSRYVTYKELLLYSSACIDIDSEPALKGLFSPCSFRSTGMKERKGFRRRLLGSEELPGEKENPAPCQ